MRRPMMGSVEERVCELADELAQEKRWVLKVEKERDAALAKLAKVREWAKKQSALDDGSEWTHSPRYVMSNCGDEVLDILDQETP